MNAMLPANLGQALQFAHCPAIAAMSVSVVSGTGYACPAAISASRPFTLRRQAFAFTAYRPERKITAIRSIRANASAALARCHLRAPSPRNQTTPGGMARSLNCARSFLRFRAIFLRLPFEIRAMTAAISSASDSSVMASPGNGFGMSQLPVDSPPGEATIGARYGICFNLEVAPFATGHFTPSQRALPFPMRAAGPAGYAPPSGRANPFHHGAAR